MTRKILNALARPVPLLAAFVFLILGAAVLFKPAARRDQAETFLPDRHAWPQSPTTKFTLKKVPEALSELDSAELVLGVSLGKESRAYPINMLNHRVATKVVNDQLDGRPVMATWCDSAHNAIVYSREIDGKTLTFGVFGQVWKGSMVMYDQETMTHWSHILGQAKRGPLTGKRLEPIPSLITDWETWSRLYPEGTVAILPTAVPEYTRRVYEDRKRYVLGIAGRDRAASWTFSQLEETPVINDSWEGHAVLAVFDPAHATARLFGRTVQGKVLTFTQEGGKLKDRETGSIWEAISGRAQAGPLAGQQLPALPAFVSHRTIWQRFFLAQQ